jgi:hypothetical protein
MHVIPTQTREAVAGLRARGGGAGHTAACG